MVEGLARVDPESVAGFDDRVMEDDVALAEAVQFEGLKDDVEHHIAQEVVRPAEAGLRGDADEAVRQPVVHDAAVVKGEIGLDAVVETGPDIVVEDVVALLRHGPVVLHV